MKPIRVWLTPPGPNPWKVVLVLEELGVPYEIVNIRFEDIKNKPFIDINPNGRVPAIEDPNNDLVLWESGAVITYIVETYDTEKRLTYEGLKDRHHVNQWLHFQMSGQGPYFGQLTWFTWLHHEKLPSAIHRYTAELWRVLGVLDGRLAVAAAAAGGGGPGEPAWLVGDKMTLADLAFVPWNAQLDLVLSQTWDQVFAGLPHARAWHGRLAALPSWQRTLAQQERCKKEQNLGTYGQPVDSEVSLAEYAGQHDGPRPA